MSTPRLFPRHQQPFGPGQTQRRVLRTPPAPVSIDDMDEAPTRLARGSRRTEPLPDDPYATAPSTPAYEDPVRDPSVTMRVELTRARHVPAMLLCVLIGVAIGMVAVIAMLEL